MNAMFDKTIRDKIISHEAEVPTQIWENVEKAIQPDHARPALFWIWLSLGVAVVASTIFMLLPSADTVQVYTHQRETEHLDPKDPQIKQEESNTRQTLDLDNPPQKSVVEISTPPTTHVSSSEASASTADSRGHQPASTSAVVPNSKFSSPLFEEHSSIELPPKTSVGSHLHRPKLVPTLEFDLLTYKLDPQIEVCPTFGPKQSLRPFVEFGALAGYPIKQLRTNQDGSNDYVDLRRSTEYVRFSASANILAGLDLSEKIEVKSGVGYTRLLEVFDFVDESASRTITNIVTDTIIINGQPTIRTDTSIITEYGQRIKLSQNRYSLIEIPMLMGYSFRHKKHSMIVQGGAFLNLAFRQKGDILDTSSQILNLKARGHEYFLNRAGLDIAAALGYQYRLGPQDQLRLLFQYRHPLESVALPQIPISQKYYQMHVGLALKHNF